MNPSTLRAASKLNLIRILSSHPEGLTLEELQRITGHKTLTELKNELGELYMIEMYPYSPQDCVDIDFDGNKVKISLPVAIDKALPLTPEEWILLRDLVFAKKDSGSATDLQLAEDIIKKINAVIPSGVWEPNEKIKSFLKKSIQDKCTIKMAYWKRDRNEKDDRYVQPWILWEENDSYLLAFDLQRKGFRSFRLDCILNAEISNEKAIELPENAKEWLNGFNQLLNHEVHEKESLATVFLTDASAYHLSQKLPLRDLHQTITFNDTEYYLYEVPIREENWFLMTILGYGKSAIIQSPPNLKAKLVEQILGSIHNFA
ncbi:MAG: WYL domain-containing protein [Leptospira sp.]|nr:WYL domain-containing protein [Leptospira sp.]